MGHLEVLLLRRRGVHRPPHLPNRGSLSRQHAVLETIQISSIDRWHKLSCQETEEHPWREVVLADTVPEEEVLLEHDFECHRNRLNATWLVHGAVYGGK